MSSNQQQQVKQLKEMFPSVDNLDLGDLLNQMRTFEDVVEFLLKPENLKKYSRKEESAPQQKQKRQNQSHYEKRQNPKPEAQQNSQPKDHFANHNDNQRQNRAQHQRQQKPVSNAIETESAKIWSSAINKFSSPAPSPTPTPAPAPVPTPPLTPEPVPEKPKTEAPPPERKNKKKRNDRFQPYHPPQDPVPPAPKPAAPSTENDFIYKPSQEPTPEPFKAPIEEPIPEPLPKAPEPVPEPIPEPTMPQSLQFHPAKINAVEEKQPPHLFLPKELQNITPKYEAFGLFAGPLPKPEEPVEAPKPPQPVQSPPQNYLSEEQVKNMLYQQYVMMNNAQFHMTPMVQPMNYIGQPVMNYIPQAGLMPQQPMMTTFQPQNQPSNPPGF